MKLSVLVLAVGGWLFWETAVKDPPLPERQIEQEFALGPLGPSAKAHPSVSRVTATDWPPFLPWEEFAREYRAQVDLARDRSWSVPILYVKRQWARGGCNSLHAELWFHGRDGVFRDTRIPGPQLLLKPGERVLECRVDGDGFFYRIVNSL